MHMQNAPRPLTLWLYSKRVLCLRWLFVASLQTVEDVNMLLASYRELKAMHGWLSTRRKRKEKIPTSQEEMSLMAADPSGTTLMQFM